MMYSRYLRLQRFSNKDVYKMIDLLAFNSFALVLRTYKKIAVY